jgi:hypothetical protein
VWLRITLSSGGLAATWMKLKGLGLEPPPRVSVLQDRLRTNPQPGCQSLRGRVCFSIGGVSVGK